jgi:uncharacterized protein
MVHVLHQTIWDLLWDVPRLAACVPGCEQREVAERYRRYQAMVRETVGPFKVQVPLAIEILQATPPERLLARARGRDAALSSARLSLCP